MVPFPNVFQKQVASIAGKELALIRLFFKMCLSISFFYNLIVKDLSFNW
jgi:hypothetical protein